jgi:hypothetical protein
MSGTDCPNCGKTMYLGSTWNEWIYECKPCEKRYNRQLEVMDLEKPHWDRHLPKP